MSSQKLKKAKISFKIQEHFLVAYVCRPHVKNECLGFYEFVSAEKTCNPMKRLCVAKSFFHLKKFWPRNMRLFCSLGGGVFQVVLNGLAPFIPELYEASLKLKQVIIAPYNFSEPEAINFPNFLRLL